MTTPNQKFQEEQTVAVGNDGAPIIIPRNVKNIAVAVIPGAGGAATAQFTLASVTEITDSPGAVDWLPWTPGSVSAPTAQANLGTVSAVRLTGVTVNAGKMQVCGDPL